MRTAGLTCSMLVTIVGALTSAGCADECASAGDCLGDQACQEGSCVERPRGPLPVAYADATVAPDAEADSGVVLPDGGDAGTSTASDGGGSGDGGASGDSGGGGSGDGGGIPGGAERLGLLQVHEIETAAGVEMRVFGRFFGFDTAAVQVAYVGRDGPCTTVDRRVSGTTGDGFDGSSISVAGFLGPFIPNGGTFVLNPTSPGVFEPEEFRAAVLWAPGQGLLTYTIAPSTTAGEITSATAQLSGAMPDGPLVTVPGEGSTIDVGPGAIEVAWTPQSFSGGLVVVEIADQADRVVLRCETTDSGRLEVPAAAASDLAAWVPGPYRVDVVYERSTQLAVPVVGGAPIDTTIRHRAGRRFPGT